MWRPVFALPNILDQFGTNFGPGSHIILACVWPFTEEHCHTIADRLYYNWIAKKNLDGKIESTRLSFQFHFHFEEMNWVVSNALDQVHWKKITTNIRLGKMSTFDRSIAD